MRVTRVMAGLGAAVMLAAVVATSTPAGAATHTVTNGSDAGAGSYRQAIADAAGDGDPVVIDFDAGLTVTLTSADVIYAGTQPITINGNGSIIDGGDAFQLLDATVGGPAVTVNDLTMRNGRTADDGAAIETSTGNVTATNSTFTGNTATDAGGAIRTDSGNVTATNSTFTGNTANDGNGGAIETDNGNVTATNSTFTGNTATSNGGAIKNSSGNVTATNSTFTGNTAINSGGAIRNSSGNVTATNSTFTGNTATDSDGGAIRNSSGNVTATNSTFTGNTATNSDGGAIRTNSGEVSLTYVTAAGNTSATSSNVHVDDAAGTLVSFGSVLADPLGGGLNCVINGTTTTNGFNYSTDTSCGFTGIGDTENGSDPLLGPLAANGGATETMLPQPGSPLIDAIPVASCAAGIDADQRGEPRPADGDQDGTFGCDIGAVEVQPVQVQPVVPELEQTGPVAARPAFTG